MLTADQLAAIAARAEAATPGPWVVDPEVRRVLGVCQIECANGARPAVAAVSISLREMDESAAFIAAAREDAPALLADIAALRALLARVRARLAEQTAADEDPLLRDIEAALGDNS